MSLVRVVTEEPTHYADVEAVDMSVTVIPLEQGPSPQVLVKSANSQIQTVSLVDIPSTPLVIAGPLQQTLLFTGLDIPSVVCNTVDPTHNTMWRPTTFAGAHGGNEQKRFYQSQEFQVKRFTTRHQDFPTD